MQTLKLFEQASDYNSWANREFLNFFINNENSDPKAVRVFAHLLLAEKTWARRMRENLDTSGFDFWAAESVGGCVRLFEENECEFKTLFATLTETELDATFSYRNSKGTAFENSWREALTHVFAHSAYHRGQTAMIVREAGNAPPYTDFIQFLRVKNKS